MWEKQKEKRREDYWCGVRRHAPHAQEGVLRNSSELTSSNDAHAWMDEWTRSRMCPQKQPKNNVRQRMHGWRDGWMLIH